MGRHLSIIQPERATRPARLKLKRPRSRGHVSLSLFAFLAASAFVLVTIVDPYSGATASPYFQVAGDRFGGQAAQEIEVAGAYTNTISRDNFTVTEKPKPAPVVASKTASSSSAPSAGIPDPGSAKAVAQEKVAARGWGDDQYSCLVSLWNKESGWRVNAANPSGAYGIPQALPGSKMASAGPNWETDAGTQIEWGLGYITGRYGTPCGAWAHSVDNGWY